MPHWPAQEDFSSDFQIDRRPQARLQQQTYERYLGSNELSYFLPSRGVTENTVPGANDMYCIAKFRTKLGIINYSRIVASWTLLRLRDPQLAAALLMEDGKYGTARYSYTVPASASDALADGRLTIHFRDGWTGDQVLDAYVNGPRTLSNKAPVQLIVAAKTETEYSITLCVAHWLADGIGMDAALHQYLSILGSPNLSDDDIFSLVEKEWKKQAQDNSRSSAQVLPASAEERLPQPKSTLQAAAAFVEAHMQQDRYIGGHVFPKTSTTTRQNILKYYVLDKDQTQQMLTRCKKEGVTTIQVVFALCNIAWIKTMPFVKGAADSTLPMMIYSSVNHRPFFPKPPKDVCQSQSYLSLAYYNIILPTFLPKDRHMANRVFWHRCRDVRAQTKKNISHPLFGLRAQVMNLERRNRSVRFAKEDDEIAGIVPSQPRKEQSTCSPPPPPPRRKDPPPSFVLLGVSTLGNLDVVFTRSCYPDFQLSEVHPGTRKPRGGMLLFAYTFDGKLTLSFGWDKPAFDEDVVNRFWGEFKTAVDLGLLNAPNDGPAVQARL